MGSIEKIIVFLWLTQDTSNFIFSMVLIKALKNTFAQLRDVALFLVSSVLSKS